jgi:hypothetical protein
MSNTYFHFSSISKSPKPTGLTSLFRGAGAGSSYDVALSQQLQDLITLFQSQSSLLDEITRSLTGGKGKSALQNILGGASFGGSALGGIANAASSGFSWQSILKDVFPLGGLISGFAGLFRSTPTPPPLNEYDAPPSLSFDAVLGPDGQLSQGSVSQFGNTRASSPGLDLVDAAGGSYSPYSRAANGSLVPIEGDPTVRYPGTLNLPEMVQSLVGTASPVSSTQTAAVVPIAPTALGGTNPGTGEAPAEAGISQNLPAFDKQWFDDHGSLIASAVRNQLLNFHPIVDAINDL